MATAASLSTNIPASQQWKVILEDIVPAQGEWSEELYLALTDHNNRLIEFTDGFLEVLPMPTDKHQCILEYLYFAFSHFIKPRGGKAHIAPVRVRIRARKFREPDIMLLLSATDKRRQNRFWLGADLALEVASEDKPERDLIDKRGDYAEAGIAEYWIVNPQTDAVTVLRLEGDRYEEAGVYGRGQIAASVLMPEFSVAVDDVFNAD